MKKIITSLFVSVMLMLCAALNVISAEDSDGVVYIGEQEIEVGKYYVNNDGNITDVESSTDNYVYLSKDVDNNYTLELKNFTYSGSERIVKNDNNEETLGCLIEINKDMIINLIGDNSFTYNNSNSIDYDSFVVCAYADITIQGSGFLTVTNNTEVQSTESLNVGIYIIGNYKQTSGIVSTTSGNSIGQTFGICANDFLLVDGEFTAIGGEVVKGGGDYPSGSAGIFVIESFSQEGGTLLAKGTENNNYCKSIGIGGVLGDVTIKGNFTVIGKDMACAGMVNWPDTDLYASNKCNPTEKDIVDLSDMDLADCKYISTKPVTYVYIGNTKIEKNKYYCVDGNSVVECNNPTDKYVYLTKEDGGYVLKLNNFNYSGEHRIDIENYEGTTLTTRILVEINNDMIIELNGSNSFEFNDPNPFVDDSCVVFANKDIVIKGDGSLTIKNNTNNPAKETSNVGLCIMGDCIQESGKVTLTSGESSYSSPLISVDYTINSGELNANAGNSSSRSYGLFIEDELIINGGKVIANGGDVVATTDSFLNYTIEESSSKFANLESSGISAGSVKLAGGDVITTGGDLFANAITGEDYIAKGSTTGVYARDFTQTGGKLQANGGDVDGDEFEFAYSIGVNGNGKHEQTGGELLAQGANTTNEMCLSIGAGSDNEELIITIGDNSAFTAIGSDFAIFNKNKITCNNELYASNIVNPDKEDIVDYDVNDQPNYKYISSIPNNPPHIIRGNDSVWDKDTDLDLEVVSDSLYPLFEEVIIDNRVLSRDNYTTEAGSTIVTLKNAYLKSLALGTHEIGIKSRNGIASTNFTIIGTIPSNPSSYKIPKTGIK